MTSSNDFEEDNIMPQMYTNNDRRSSDNEDVKYTDARWHSSKSVSITNTLGFLTLFIGGYWAYDETIDRMDIAQSESNRRISVIETTHEVRLKQMAEKLDGATKDRIHATTVLEMFKTRDIQIKNLAEKMAAMEVRQGETNRLLTAIYREMPKQGGAN